MNYKYLILFTWLFASCGTFSNETITPVTKTDSNLTVKDTAVALVDTLSLKPPKPDSLAMSAAPLPSNGKQEVNTGNVYADSVVSFAESLVGIPYKYASTDPAVGFDCSGFITFIFSRYSISVPRSSKDFENVGTPVLLLAAKRGDLILFTGTDTTDKTIGHMGIVTSNNGGNVNFIHSSSGKAMGVTISALGKEYMKRYVKTIRVFNQ